MVRDNDMSGARLVRWMAVEAALDEAQKRWPGSFAANRPRAPRFVNAAKDDYRLAP